MAIGSVELEGRTRPVVRLPAWARAWWPLASWTLAIGLFVLDHQVKPGFADLDVAGAVVLTHALYGLSALFILLPAVFAQREAGPVQRTIKSAEKDGLAKRASDIKKVMPELQRPPDQCERVNDRPRPKDKDHA